MQGSFARPSAASPGSARPIAQQNLGQHSVQAQRSPNLLPRPVVPLQAFPQPYRPLQSGEGKKIWRGCKTKELPNDRFKRYGYYINGRDKIRAMFHDNRVAISPEYEAGIKAIRESHILWRVSDCADYPQHQGKLVVSDVVLGCGIIDDKRHLARFSEKHLKRALYPSLGEVPSGNSSGDMLAVLSERDIFRVLADKVDAFRQIAVDWHFDSHATPAKSLARAAEALHNPSAEQRDMQDRARAQGEEGAVAGADAVEAPPWVGGMVKTMKGHYDTALVPVVKSVTDLDHKVNEIDDKVDLLNVEVKEQLTDHSDQLKTQAVNIQHLMAKMEDVDEVKAQGNQLTDHSKQLKTQADDIQNLMAKMEDVDEVKEQGDQLKTQADDIELLFAEMQKVKQKNTQLENELRQAKRARNEPAPQQPEVPQQPQQPQGPAAPPRRVKQTATVVPANDARKAAKLKVRITQEINGRVYYRLKLNEHWKMREARRFEYGISNTQTHANRQWGQYTVRDFQQEQEICAQELTGDSTVSPVLLKRVSSNSLFIPAKYKTYKAALERRDEELRKIGLAYETKTEGGVVYERLVGI